MNVLLLVNSVVLATGTAALGAILGVAVAVGLQVAGARVRRSLLAACLATLALPGFLVAGMWMQWVGFAGAWRVGDSWWAERLMPMACSIGVLGLMNWPITALWVDGVWNGLDRRWLDAFPELRGRELIRHLLWPTARGALAQPLLITAILALGQFTVPALFQARVWPAEIWLEYSTRFDERTALVKSLLPVAVILVLLAVLHRRGLAWRWEPRADRVNHAVQVRLGRSIRWGALGVTALILVASLAFPVGRALGDVRTWTELPAAWGAASPAWWRSAAYAAGTATLITGIGACLAARPWMAATVLPLVLPGILIGMVLSRVFALPGLSWVRGTWLVVIVALGMRYLMVGWYTADRAWRAMDGGVRAVARLEGLGGWGRVQHVLWPRQGAAVRGGWMVAYLLCLWDVETLILVVPPGGDSLALTVFNLLHYGHNAQVTALCFLLGILAVLPVVILGLGKALGRGVFSRSTRGWVAVGLAVAGLGTGCSPGGRSDSSSMNLSSRLFARVEVIGGRGTGPGYFNKPRSVAVDAADNLYVVDMTGRVQRFDRDGRWVQSWQLPETTRGKAKGMAAAPEAGVIVVEPHYHRVNQFAADGRQVGQWGEHGTNVGQLWFPRAVALGGAGDCYVSEYGVVERVQRFRLTDGLSLGAFGSEGTRDGEFNRVEGLDVAVDGSVYVADSCNHRIQVFSADGRWQRSHGRAGHGLGEFSYPYDVRIDRDGRQYVCEFGNSRVQVLDASDRPLEVLGGPGAAPDRLNNPWSLCLDSRGNLFVADALNHRVVKYVRRAGT